MYLRTERNQTLKQLAAMTAYKCVHVKKKLKTVVSRFSLFILAVGSR